ncbi:inner membrane protein [Monaibacterium marinum]|uniref:Inner membrane protein n=1 Tax=Pontivivens marinum TaxID=1690039 RepID=A0A2C9CU44_9RHOB|nr:mitofilin family membrane protein [Monaibacterium marinum]SOH94792.1 inner membrane protein [Monaibacterium marinum]
MSDPKRPDDQTDTTDITVDDEQITPKVEDAELATETTDESVVEEPEAEQDATEESETSDDEAAATTPWGGAPADVTARSTSDPTSPAYVAPAAADAPHDSSDDEYHEEAGSVAGRVLFWLFLLVAGGALVLWGGPKVAPHLPSGMAPVAEWLTPGNRAAQMQTQEQVEALEARLSARINALNTGLTPDGVTEQINAAVLESEMLTAETITALAQDVNALSDQVAAADGAPIEQRLAQAETLLEGLNAEFSALRTDLTGLAAGEGGITGQNAAEIDAFTAALTGLRAELDAVSARTGAQDQRIDEVAATAERQLRTAREEVAQAEAEAEARVAVASEQADMVELANALDTGTSFEGPLGRLAEQTEITAPLPALAASGVTTQAELEARLPNLAHQAIRADIAPGEDDGILSSATSFLRARVSGRSLVEREGDDADAILSRVEARLRRGDLGAALTEAEQLTGAAADTLSPWTADLRARHEALTAYTILADRLDASN